MAVTLIALNKDGDEFPLDITKGSPVTADFNFKDIKDLKAKGSYTYNFRLPSSVANEKYFGHYFMVGSYLGGSGSYNPFVRREAYLLQDTIEVFRGFIQLANVYLREGNRYEYECILFSSEVNFLDSLKGLNMSQLNFIELQHDFTTANIFESFNSNSIDSGNLIWSFWDYGQGFASNDALTGYDNYFKQWTPPWAFNNQFPGQTINPTKLRPQVKVSHIFKKILEYSNYTYTSTFLDSAFFNKIYCDLNWSAEAPNAVDIPPQFYKVIATNATNQQITYFSGQFNQLLQAPTEVTDVSGAWSQVTSGTTTYSKFTTQRSGNYIFTLSANLTIPSPSSNGSDGFRAWRNPDFSTYPFSASFGWNQVGNQAVSGATSYTTSMYCNQGDEVIFGWRNSEERDAQTITIADFKITIETSNSFTAILGNQVVIPNFFGDLKVEDWVRGIMTKFNLIISPNPNDARNLRIEPYNDYVDSGNTVDWSDKIDFNKDVQIIPPTKYCGKRVVFGDTTDGNYVSDTIMNSASSAANAFNYGSYIQPGVQNQFADKDTRFQTIFSPTINYPLNGMDVNLDFYSCPRFKVQDNILKNAGGMCLSFYHGTHTLPSGRYYMFQGDVNGKNVVPFFSEYSEKGFDETAAPNVYSINWHPGVTIAPQDWDALAFKGLAIKYWRNYLLDNFNVNSRMLSCHMRLTPNDIANFSFADIITVNSQNYKVNSIKGYPVSSTGLCKVELLATFDSISVPIVVIGDSVIANDDPEGDVIECDFDLTGFDSNTGEADFVTLTTGAAATITQDCCTGFDLYWYPAGASGKCYNSLPNGDPTDPPDEDTDVITQDDIDDDGNVTGNPHDDIDDQNDVIIDIIHEHHQIDHLHFIKDDKIKIKGNDNKINKHLQNIEIKGNKNLILGEGGSVGDTGGRQIKVEGDKNRVRSGVQRALVIGNENNLETFETNLERYGENITFETTLRDVICQGDYAKVMINGDRVLSQQKTGVSQGSNQQGEFIIEFTTPANTKNHRVGQYGIADLVDGKNNSLANKNAIRFPYKTSVVVETELIGFSSSSTRDVFVDKAIIKSEFILSISSQPIVLSSSVVSSNISAGLPTFTIEAFPVIKNPYSIGNKGGGGIAFNVNHNRYANDMNWTLKVNYQTTPIPSTPNLPVNNPTSLTDCILWLDAANEQSVTRSGIAVSGWADISGETNSVLQPTSVFKPTYRTDFWHRPSLFFDGTSANLFSTDTDLLALAVQNNTFVACFHSTATSSETNGQVIVGHSQPTNDCRVGLRVNASGNGGDGLDSVCFSSQSSTTNQNSCSIASASITDVSIAVGRRDGTATKITDGNGNTDTNALADLNAAVTRFVIGAASTSGGSDTNEFRGDIYEVFCYSRALTDAEVDRVILYLKQKWNIV